MKFFQKLMIVAVSLVMVGMVAITPNVTNAATTNQLIHKGMHNASVKPLQHQLRSFNYYQDNVDGVFGVHTYQAVNDFQKDHGLRVDGIAGPNTKKALKKVHSLQRIYKKAGIIQRGDDGKAVKKIQSQLKHLHYYKGNLDGKYGSKTKEAVKSFQKANELTVDGIAGPKTYSALIHNPTRKEITEKESIPKEASNDTAVKSEHTKSVNHNQSTSNVKNHHTAKTHAKSNSKLASGTANAKQNTTNTLYMEATAYTAYCAGCSGVTATGINLKSNPGAKVIAVDPNVIPLGSKVWVEGYGYAIAGDTGGAIKGNRIDLFVSSHSAASHYGRKKVKVKVYR